MWTYRHLSRNVSAAAKTLRPVVLFSTRPLSDDAKPTPRSMTAGLVRCGVAQPLALQQVVEQPRHRLGGLAEVLHRGEGAIQQILDRPATRYGS